MKSPRGSLKPSTAHRPDEAAASMRPPSVYANLSCPAGCPCEVTGPLYGPRRVGVRLVMILLSHRGWTAVAIAELVAAIRPRCAAGSTATTSTGWPGLSTGPDRDGHAWAAPSLATASAGC